LVATSYEDQIFDVVPDACFKIVRTWTVINWCVVGDDVDQEVIEASEEDLVPVIGTANADLDGDGDRDDRTFRDSWNTSFQPEGTEVNGCNDNNLGTLPPDTDLDADVWDGYITYQQIIEVKDNEAPVIDPDFGLEDLCIINGNDGTDNDFSDCVSSGVLPTPTYEDCIINVNGENQEGEIIDNDVIITTEVFDAAGTLVSNSTTITDLPVGCYVARYTAIDRCGNTAANDFDFCIEDCKFPTPYCKDGLVVELMYINDPNNTSFEPMAAVWAADLDAGSYDNCPGAVKLSFSADVTDIGVEFNCNNLGENTVQLWVTDAAGNQDFCETFILVQANQNQCDSDPLVVAGNAATENNGNVEEVTVSINNASGFTTTDVTGSNGNFNFNNVPIGGDYTITPAKDINPLNGVTTFDLVKISKHILNIELLDSPYKMIAADANNSESITTLDLVHIRKLILLIDTEFQNNSSWRFVETAYSFPNATNPWIETFPEVININNLGADALNNDFVAVKIGDVNGSANANQLLGADDRTNGALQLTTQNIAMKAGEIYTVAFHANYFNHYGYQFTLNFDQNLVEFASIEAGSAAAENFGLTLLDEGVITASWNEAIARELANEDVLFSLNFTAKTTTELSDVIRLDGRYTTAEAYAANGDLQHVQLTFGEQNSNEFALYQNYPNPFGNATIIGFNMPIAGNATLTITDITGKTLHVIEGEYTKGYNEVNIKTTDLSATGVLHYRLETATNAQTRKMVVIE